MFKRLIVLLCLVSFCPAAVGAQDLAPLKESLPAAVAQTSTDQPAREVDLSIPVALQKATVLAANEARGSQLAEPERPRKTHTGLTFQEFVDVHFGDYRWVWWAGAAAVLVAIHVAAAD
ncbi:hypothetical protein GMLC_34700 [Geomonas limicola]|uniref:Uncharacterized protein n=1 Tax=Geomonas limicola TaxID=2740186 RepID=A0A6V8NBJ8_9BACT|nr:hypothetical protein [Geomonas limicola]GFO69891.1 hypothetical protein GMLC_34700 [Geomonas limicola]